MFLPTNSEERIRLVRVKRTKSLLLFLGATLLASAAPVGLRAQKGAAQKTAPNSARPVAGRRGAATTKRATRTSSKPVSGKRSKPRRRERAQKAPTPERISEIQAALAREGAFQGKPNGKWDTASVEGMKRFQAANHLNPSGKLDALTLQKLGLGSEIAGRGAPRPPVAPAPASSTPELD